MKTEKEQEHKRRFSNGEDEIPHKRCSSDAKDEVLHSEAESSCVPDKFRLQIPKEIPQDLYTCQQEISRLQTHVADLQNEVSAIARTLSGSPVRLGRLNNEARYMHWYNPPGPVTPKDFEGKTVDEAFPWLPDVRQFAELYQRALASGQRRSRALSGELGPETCVLSIANPLKAPDGQVTGLMAMCVDLTAQKQVEDHVASLTRDVQALNNELKKRVLELEQEKANAERANRAKSDFLARISHELKTPLHAMQLCTDMLGQTNLDQRQRELTDTMRTSESTLMAMISDVLDFSKAESGRMQLEAAGFDLRRLIQDIIELTVPLATASDSKFDQHIASELPQCVKGDALRLKQILLNLLSNAFKFAKKARVTLKMHPITSQEWSAQYKQFRNQLELQSAAVSATPMVQEREKDEKAPQGLAMFIHGPNQPPQYVICSPNYFVPSELEDTSLLLRVTVQDTGIGVAQSAMPRIFNAFEQADESTTRHFGGTGLGLSIVRKIVGRCDVVDSESIAGTELMRGCMRLESVVGRFTAFTVDLPFEACSGPVSSPDSGAASKPIATLALGPLSSEQQKVLVVDDNAVNRKVAVQALQGLGCTTDIAEDGQEAVEIVTANPALYCAILMDLHMPVKDGFQAIKEIRDWELQRSETLQRRQFIVSMSASPEQAPGADRQLSKPVQLAELGSVVAEAIASLVRKPGGLTGQH